MGYCLSESGMDAVFRELSAGYILYAPKVFPGGNTYSGTDCIRYGEITHVRDIETGQKSDFSFKEVLLPLSQTLFYFTEDDIKEPELPQRDALIFLRSCDLHALKRLDEIYHNEFSDIYYQRLREKCRFVLIGCRKIRLLLCVDMGTNISEAGSAFESKDGRYYMDNLRPYAALEKHAEEKVDYIPSYVTKHRPRYPYRMIFPLISPRHPCGGSMTIVVLTVAVAHWPVPPAPVLPCRTFFTKITEKPVNGAGCRLPVWWTVLPIPPGEVPIAGKMGIGCASGRCTRFMISKNALGITCALDAGVVKISARNISP